MLIYRLSLCVSLCVSLSWLSAQPLRFGSGIIGGGTLAQIDGDDMQGYDKPGLYFGLRGIAYILPKLEVHTELTFSQQGSQSKEFNTRSPNPGRQINLNYGYITGLIAINDWFHPIKEYYRMQLVAGFSFGRLINFSTLEPPNVETKNVPLAELQTNFNSNDLSLTMGANFKIVRNAGVTFRYNRSMSKLIDRDVVQPLYPKKQVLTMKSYFLALGAFYNF